MASKEGDAILIMTLNPEKTLNEAGKSFLEQYKLELKEQSNDPINDIPALTLIADQKQENSTLRVVVSFIHFENYIYQMMGVTEISRFQNHQNTFLTSIRGFRELKEADKLNKTADVIRIKVVPQNMTVQAALEYFKTSKDRLEQISLLNGMYLQDKVEKGSLIKVIEK